MLNLFPISVFARSPLFPLQYYPIFPFYQKKKTEFAVQMSAPFLRLKNTITLRKILVFKASFSKSSTHSGLLQTLIHTINEREECSEFSMPRLDSTSEDQHLLRSNSMISRLCQEGRLFEAQKLFDEIPYPDVISSTALISGYVKCGMVEEARKLFDRVDAKKDVVTWTAMINGYVKTRRMSDAERLFRDMPEKNVVSWNTMLHGYAKCGMIDKALRLFAKMAERNVVSWNAILVGLGQCGRIEEARMVFHLMPERNLVSWTAIVKGLSKIGRVDEARMLFERMPERNLVSWNAMISGFAQNFWLNEAFDLFESMPEKDVSSWNVMITGCIKNGDLRRANRLFNEMPEKNVVSWTAMIHGNVQASQSEEALRIFADMLKDSRVRPNERTFSSALVACSNLAALGMGKQIHQRISKTVYRRGDFVISALLSMYSKCGDLWIARKLFDDEISGRRDLVSWNGMIAAYAYHGYGTEVITLFQEMQNIGLKPNDATYMGLLVACSHAGLVGEGFMYFDMLVNDENVKLREDHFTCLIDLCGRAGRLKEAFDFIQQLPNEASAHVWGTLLAGCNAHEDANRGKLAAQKLVEAEPENAGSLMMLSNMYASNRGWKEAAQLRQAMKDRGLKKQPGCSWIEVANRVHVFAVGHDSRGENEQICNLIATLHSKLKKAGYIVAENVGIIENG